MIWSDFQAGRIYQFWLDNNGRNFNPGQKISYRAQGDVDETMKCLSAMCGDDFIIYKINNNDFINIIIERKR